MEGLPRSSDSLVEDQMSLDFSTPLSGAGETKISARYRLELVREAAVPFLVDEPPTLNRPAALARFLWDAVFCREPREVLAVLFLDHAYHPSGYFIASTGSLDRTLFDPRIVLTAALLHNAASIVIAHNHPSGAVQPSTEDRMATDRLEKAAGIVGIRLCDHLILGGRETFFSFRESGKTF
jgi:DNA repair protein RadC